MSEYNIQQKVFCLNLTSNAASVTKGSKVKLQSIATERIKAILSDPETQKLIGAWEVVWGPVVYQYDGEGKIPAESNVADSVMYVAKSQDGGESDWYVIAIAATNPTSWYSWIVKNLWVNKTKPWNDGEPWNSEEETPEETHSKRVSAGTSRGLQILCEMKSDKKDLVTYLKELTSSASKPISISICGHSLGGALSPALALSLMDRREEWDSKGDTTLSVSPSAGATPGNAEFAAYYDSQLGEVTDRIWNQLDFVPHGWQQDMLEQNRTIYEPYIKQNALINLLVDSLLSLSKEANYQQICPHKEGFNIGYNSEIDNALEEFAIDELSEWLAKLILQHQGIEDPPEWMINSVAKQIESRIEELLEKKKSGQPMDDEKTNEIEVEPYVEKIIAELKKEKSGSNINEEESKKELLTLMASLWDFVKYVLQVGYQHIYAYNKELQISDFMAIYNQKIAE